MRAQELSSGGLPIAHRRHDGEPPTVVFLGGYSSDMGGTKALALEAHCRARGRGVVCFDYRGHGDSGGAFCDFCLSDWRDDALAVMDRATAGPLVLVGSSMGGWLMLLAALARRERVAGLVGLAAAADFSEDIRLELSASQRRALDEDGVIHLGADDEAYPVTKKFLEDGRRHLLLDRAIALDCPVRLLHGMRDAEVPWRTSVRVMEQLRGADVRVTLLKDGGHRLSAPSELKLIMDAVDEVAAIARRAQRP